MKALQKELRKNWILFLMLFPVLLYFLIFFYIPMPGVYMAFTQYNIRDGIFGSKFVGLANFRFLYKNLLSMTRTTVLYNLAFILTGFVLELGLAIMFSELTGKIYKKTAQSFLFLPYFISYYAATDILDTYVFRSVAKTFNVGFGTAAGLYQSLFGFLLVLTVNAVIRKVDADYALF